MSKTRGPYNLNTETETEPEAEAEAVPGVKSEAVPGVKSGLRLIIRFLEPIRAPTRALALKNLNINP